MPPLHPSFLLASKNIALRAVGSMNPAIPASNNRIGLAITILLISKPAETRFVIEILVNYEPES